jgi:glycyl-tRNA synthetase beta chain
MPTATPRRRLLKKLAALGVDAGAAAAVIPTLKRQPDGKAEALFLDSVVPGATLAEGCKRLSEAALAALPIPKVMSYQLADGWSSVNFVRPAHKLVALHGTDVVPISVLGLSAGRETQGHRFEAKNLVVSIKDADSYAQQLEAEGAVIAGFAARRAEIEKQLKAAAAKEGLQAIEDDALLDEVTALVERPNVLTCQFEEEFLDVPQECLILTMKANQKYFPLLRDGKLTHKFLVVSNINPADPVGGDRRQRARGAPAPGRCQVLLRPGPQEVADGSHTRPGQGGLSQQAGHPGRARRTRRRVGARYRPKARRREAIWRMRPTVPRCWPRPTC